MNKLQLSRVSMLATILLLAAFEGYWLHKLYKDEYRNLEKEVDISFREMMNKLQLHRFEHDTTLVGQAFSLPLKRPLGVQRRKGQQDRTPKPVTFVYRSTVEMNEDKPEMIESVTVKSGYSMRGAPPPALIEVIMKQKAGRPLPAAMHKDSFKVYGRGREDEIGPQRFGRILINRPGHEMAESPMIRLLTANKTINDSIPVRAIDSAYKTELAKINKKLAYTILFKAYGDSSIRKKDFEKDSTGEILTKKVFVGYNTPYSYQAKFHHTGTIVLKQMQLQIVGSVLLLLLVIGSFVLMYRNLMAQQRLTGIKNDFISNITHELKTPIATVGVAIEALRNFNALQSPERTKEYLDISAAELQRLGLLVDKVLKLSMFERKQVELNKEPFDLKELVEETMKTMKLQFEKQKAAVSLAVSNNSFMMEADKLHITSVIYNLLDNALKYSGENPVIHVALSMLQQDTVELRVSDNGVGIAPQHQLKIFEKFYRVPTGNKHDIKGYGLGLSYVSEVVKSHKGSIHVESEPGKGSVFIVALPVREA